jgi:hypothetical protein
MPKSFRLALFFLHARVVPPSWEAVPFQGKATKANRAGAAATIASRARAEADPLFCTFNPADGHGSLPEELRYLDGL